MEKWIMWIGKRRLVIASISALILSACGGGGGGGPAGGTPPPSANTPSPPPAPAPTPTPPPAPPPAPPKIAITARGSLEGLPTFATIGSAGGTLTSSDGRLKVTIPSGALATNTQIGIEPITGKAPGALGLGYRLTPENVTFPVPITLTFTHSANEATASRPDLLRVATQDANGRWRVMNTLRDAAQRTLTVTTTHFSDWSYVSGLQILPASATVAVNKTQSLQVINCGDGPDPDGGNSQTRLLLECVDEELPPLARNWSANSIPGGNEVTGTVVGASRGTYTAPARAPAQNPVAVSAQVNTPAGLTTLVSNIKVVDAVTAYEGTVFGEVIMTVGPLRQVRQLSANLRFTYNSQKDNTGSRVYDATGTAHVRSNVTPCGAWAAGNAPVRGDSELATSVDGPQAGYRLDVAAVVHTTAMCGSSTVLAEITGGAFADYESRADCLLSRSDSGATLAGSWLCNAGNGIEERSNWTLRAVD